MKKYPHGITLAAVCSAIDAYKAHEDNVPEIGILKAFEVLLADSDVGKNLHALASESAARGEVIERMIGHYSAAGYHAVQNSLNPAQSLLYDAIQVPKQPATDAYLNSVRAEAILEALDSCTALCDADCVMDAHDISHEDAELRSSGAAELGDELVAYANQLRTAKGSAKSSCR